MHSVDEELGTIDNLSRNQRESEGESTVLRGPNKRERIGGYEQPDVIPGDTSEDTSEDTTADADVTSSAASLVVTSHAGSLRRSKVRLDLTTTDSLHGTTDNLFTSMNSLHK